VLPEVLGENITGLRRAFAEVGADADTLLSKKANKVDCYVRSAVDLGVELHDDLGEDIHHLYRAAAPVVRAAAPAASCGNSSRPEDHRRRAGGLGQLRWGGGALPPVGNWPPGIAEICEVFDCDVIDDGIKASDSEAFETCRYLVRNFGILIGGVAGGVVCKAWSGRGA
jgi:cystathionine beta-synthase